MSLQPEPAGPVPEGGRVSPGRRSQGERVHADAGRLGVLYDDASFRPLFAVRGWWAGAPGVWRS